MNNIKKYVAAFAIALMTGFGVFSVVTAINAQTTGTSEKQNVQKEQKDSKDELNESEENEANENEADENEDGEEGEENEADEQAEQAKLAQEATVSRQQAEAIALGQVSGTITDGEIEKEDGKLIWSFDIKNSQDQMFDVEVDANTGEVLKAQPDNENDDEDEGTETTTK